MAKANSTTRTTDLHTLSAVSSYITRGASDLKEGNSINGRWERSAFGRDAKREFGQLQQLLRGLSKISARL